ncbi:MAG: hypothetical protein IJX07_05685, partial [Bacillales bacterium]|nr:hypothetical protein [Bacillales bacterium]
MKKTIALLLSLLLLWVVLSGCDNTPKLDVWDGSVASSFASGEGTDSNPYIIEKTSQLAFLAQEINSGKDYSGKYFLLACDLDLNNHEWTPIGNGTYNFAGFFDGNHHSILNLK